MMRDGREDTRTIDRNRDVLGCTSLYFENIS
jgi:hypothetical protein